VPPVRRQSDGWEFLQCIYLAAGPTDVELINRPYKAQSEVVGQGIGGQFLLTPVFLGHYSLRRIL
jgi:hypothetical protein